MIRPAGKLAGPGSIEAREHVQKGAENGYVAAKAGHGYCAPESLLQQKASAYLN